MDESQPLLGTKPVCGSKFEQGRELTRRLHQRVSEAKKAYRFKSLAAVKPVEAFLVERYARPEGKRLAVSLGLLDLLGYGVGCTVGAGIYSLIGDGVSIAGPGITISFMIGAISCVFTALAYSEFAARVPVTGSAYTFAYASFGELLAWIIGWNLTLEYCISAAAISRSWGDYFTDFWTQLGLHPPYWLNKIPLGSTSLSPAAAAIVLLCTIVMLFGISTSSTFNVIITILNIFILLFFIGVGACRVDPTNWVVENNSFVPYGATSVFAGAGTMFFSYLGFDMVSSLAEETKNPQKNLPRGIIGSLAAAGLIYVAVSLVATGMVPFLNIKNANAPLVVALEQTNLAWAAKVVSAGSLLGLTTATFTCLLGQPRIFYTMARDGLLFPCFQWTNKGSETPVVGTIVTGLFTAALAFFITLEDLADAISIGTLIAFSIVCAGVMALRYDRSQVPHLPMLLVAAFCISCFLSAISFTHSFPLEVTVVFAAISLLVFGCIVVMHFWIRTHNVPLTFKCPLVPVVPCVGITINLYMLAGLKTAAWIRLGVWLVVGLVIYFLYGIRNSKLRKLSSGEATSNNKNGTLVNKSLQD